MVVLFDQNIDNNFESPDWVKVAQALKLDVSGSTAATQRAREVEATATDRPTPSGEEIFEAE